MSDHIKTSLYLPKELKKRIKIYCAKYEIATANRFILDAIQEKLEKEVQNEGKN